MTLTKERRLTRSRDDCMLFGVCGGIGEYFGIDPTVVRLVFVMIALFGGASIIAYPILAIIIPPARPSTPRDPGEPAPSTAETTLGELGDQPISTLEDDLASLAARRRRQSNRALAGFLLAGVGLFFLLTNLGFFWWFNWSKLWPLVLIGIGIALVLTRRPSRSDW